MTGSIWKRRHRKQQQGRPDDLLHWADIRPLERLLTWTSVHLDVCPLGRLSIWTSVHLDVCSPGRLFTWTSVHLDVCLPQKLRQPTVALLPKPLLKKKSVRDGNFLAPSVVMHDARALQRASRIPNVTFPSRGNNAFRVRVCSPALASIGELAIVASDNKLRPLLLMLLKQQKFTKTPLLSVFLKLRIKKSSTPR